MKKWILAAIVILLLSGCRGKGVTGSTVVDIEEDNETVKEAIEELSEEEKAIMESILEKQERLARTPENSTIVVIKDLKLDPKEVAIKRGMTVIWEHSDKHNNREDIVHILSAHYGEFRSPRMHYGDIFRHTFNEPGEYSYMDVIYKEGMRGSIIVGE